MRKKTKSLLLAPSLTASAIVAGLLAPTSPALAAPADSTATLVSYKSSDWSYYRAAAEPQKDWKTASVSWAKGKAPLGFGVGTGTLGTTLDNDFSQKPLASYFQNSFSLAQVPAAGVELSAIADDGVVIYVNGEEIVRKNLPSGAIKHTSYATAAPQSKNAKKAAVSTTIPASALKAGTNVISAQVQSNWRNTHNVTFDAQLVAPKSATAAAAPAAAAPAAAAPAAAAPAAAALTASPSSASNWGTPTWRDEFNYVDPKTGKPAIDKKKWNVRDRSTLGLLPDAAVPDAGQVTVDSSGVAHLKADWLSSPVKRANGGGPKQLWHKTGYMDQRTMRSGDMSYAQRWGRWEIRAKVPTGPKTYGALAAFWLRNSQSGEIDIMESWGYNEKAAPGGQRIGTATTTVHTNTMGGGNQKYFWTHADGGAHTPVWDGFHTYAFELMPTYAAIFVDNVQVARVTPKTHPNLWNTKYFGTPLHVRLNLHVGASEKYWGLPDPANKEWTKALDYQVDYVRIWNYQAGK